MCAKKYLRLEAVGPIQAITAVTVPKTRGGDLFEVVYSQAVLGAVLYINPREYIDFGIWSCFYPRTRGLKIGYISPFSPFFHRIADETIYLLSFLERSKDSQIQPNLFHIDIFIDAVACLKPREYKNFNQRSRFYPRNRGLKICNFFHFSSYSGLLLGTVRYGGSWATYQKMNFWL